MTETAKERGYRWGQHFKAEKRAYDKPNGHYPSNPYKKGSDDAHQFDAGYEEAINAQER